MESDERKFIVIIVSSNRAAFLYKKLIELGYNVEIMATPCKLSNGCTKSIKCKREHLDIIKEQAEKYNIIVKSIFQIIMENGKYKYLRIE